MKRLILLIIFVFNIHAFADEYTDIRAAAENAGIDGVSAQHLAQKTKTAGYSKQSLVRIKNMLENTKGEEARKIAEKAAEGIAKRVPESRVLAAMEKISERYGLALELAVKARINAKNTEGFANLAVDAMTAGAKVQNLEKVAQEIARQNEEREQYALAVMSLYREMARYGATDEKSSEVAVIAMKKLSVSQINEYKKSFGQNAAYGGADATAEAMSRNISRGNSASSMGGGNGGSSSGGGSSGGGNGGGNGGGGRN